MMVAVSYASGSAATVLFYDNFAEYPVGTQVIYNFGTNTYPQYYQVDGGSPKCPVVSPYPTGYGPAAPGYSWPSTCQSLNDEGPLWEPPAVWDVSNAVGGANGGTQALYLQVRDVADKVTINFFADPNSLHTGASII
jgi:hypothetical protein